MGGSIVSDFDSPHSLSGMRSHSSLRKPNEDNHRERSDSVKRLGSVSDPLAEYRHFVHPVDWKYEETLIVRDVVEFFADAAGPFQIYTNPMRSDGVFIGQEKHRESYGIGLEGPIYPAVPSDAKTFPMQVSLSVAEKALDILNGVTHA